MKTGILTRDMFWRLQMFQACFLFLPTVYAESHNLRYYVSGVSNPVGFPVYSLKMYIDDVELGSYDDETRIFQSSIKGQVDADYWVDRSLTEKLVEMELKKYIIYINSVLNETHRNYVYQLKFGCTVDGEENHGGYMEYARNGKEFLVFDKDKTLYIPMTLQAEILTQFFNKDDFLCHRNKNLMEINCAKLVQRYLKYASYELEKKVRPEVKVWGHRQSDDVTRLQCLVYGFHPRPVDVKWVRNGEDDVPSDEMSPILPHPDGTYQIRVSVEVPTKEGDTYSCHVDHSSLRDETLSVKWEPKKERIQFIVAIVAVLLFLIGLGIFIYRFRLKNMEED